MKDERRRAAEMPEEGAQAASATECTGLVPALPEGEDELERLTALYGVVPPGKRDRHP